MKQNMILTFSLIATILCTPLTLLAARGDLLQVQKLQSLSVFEVAQKRVAFLGASDSQLSKVTTGLDLYKLVYESVGVKGQVNRLSGLLALPSGARLSTVLYAHGTTLLRASAPSTLNREGLNSAVFYGSLGFAVALPDDIGFGISNDSHPYMHASSEATASADLVRAMLQFNQFNLRHKMTAKSQAGDLTANLFAQAATTHPEFNDRLYVTGYSQGGQVAMAIQQEIEANPIQGIYVAGNLPMSGAYDLYGSEIPYLFSSGPQSDYAPMYLAYVIYEMNQVYDFLPSMNSIFQMGIETKLAGLFDGTKDFLEIKNALPSTVQAMLKPDFIKDCLKSTDHLTSSGSVSGERAAPQGEVVGEPNGFMRAMKLNSPIKFHAHAPIVLYFGGKDVDSPISNVAATVASISAAGAQIKSVNVGAMLDHHSAVIPSYLATARQLFEWEKSH